MRLPPTNKLLQSFDFFVVEINAPKVLNVGRLLSSESGKRYNIAKQVAEYAHRVKQMLLFLALFVEKVGLYCLLGESDVLL